MSKLLVSAQISQTLASIHPLEEPQEPRVTNLTKKPQKAILLTIPRKPQEPIFA